MTSVQSGQQGIIIRIDDELYAAISRRRGPGQSFNDVIRQQIGLARRVKWVRQ